MKKIEQQITVRNEKYRLLLLKLFFIQNAACKQAVIEGCVFALSEEKYSYSMGNNVLISMTRYYLLKIY